MFLRLQKRKRIQYGDRDGAEVAAARQNVVAREVAVEIVKSGRIGHVNGVVVPITDVIKRKRRSIKITNTNIKTMTGLLLCIISPKGNDNYPM